MTEQGMAIVENSGSLELCDGFKLTPYGCTVEGQPSLESYGDALAQCGMLANASQWALGDLIVYGEGRGDWGEMYTQFLDQSSRSYAQVSQSARVSREFPPGEARQYAASLSWSHHRALLQNDSSERLRLLRQAKDNAWSVETLRQSARDVSSLSTASSDGAPLVEVLAAVSGPALSVKCLNTESADALVRWCDQFPTEYTVAR